jgi:hypothetical protein
MIVGAPAAASASLPMRETVLPHRPSSDTRTVAMSQIKPEPVRWLWPSRIPRGAVTVLAGSPGLGKSLLSIHLAAGLSRGTLDGQLPGNVLLLTAEDSLAFSVRPRLEAAGADLSRVHVPRQDQSGLDQPLLLPSQINRLRAYVDELRTALVVIDPLSAHLDAKVNSWKDQEVRQALAPLHQLADATGSAVLVVAHLNKGPSTDPLQRLGGSIGIPAAARSVLLLGRDPDDPAREQTDQRVLAHVKSNVGELAPSLLLRIDAVELSSEVKTARIRCLGVSARGGSDLLAEPTRRGAKLEAAIEFLLDELGEGPRPASEVEARANEASISTETLKRARRTLGVTSAKSGFDGGWEWALATTDGDAPDGAK